MTFMLWSPIFLPCVHSHNQTFEFSSLSCWRREKMVNHLLCWFLKEISGNPHWSSLQNLFCSAFSTSIMEIEEQGGSRTGNRFSWENGEDIAVTVGKEIHLFKNTTGPQNPRDFPPGLLHSIQCDFSKVYEEFHQNIPNNFEEKDQVSQLLDKVARASWSYEEILSRTLASSELPPETFGFLKVLKILLHHQTLYFPRMSRRFGTCTPFSISLGQHQKQSLIINGSWITFMVFATFKLYSSLIEPSFRSFISSDRSEYIE